MALRFRKSFKLAPGVRMNLSGSGVGWTVGPRGASIGIGKRGTYLNTGIPGTGLSARQKLSGSAPRQQASKAQAHQAVAVTVSVTDDGTIAFTDEFGTPLPEQIIRVAKRQQGDRIKALIQQKCDDINREIESVGELHFLTPSPFQRPTFEARAFEIASPIAPSPQKPFFLFALFKGYRDKIEAQNQAAHENYCQRLSHWQSQKAEFEAQEARRRMRLEVEIYSDTTAMLEHLEETLQEIVWPRETLVSADILLEGRLVFIDADFPEIEDMPSKKAAVPASGYKLSVKDLSATNLQRLYMSHIHGIAFRTIGETFAALPKAEEVVFSGYSQRPSKATGVVSDEYLLSVRVNRSAWTAINFEALDAIDVVEALAAFELKRSMSKTGVFKPVEPFAPEQVCAAIS